jgi:hypothetical protein
MITNRYYRKMICVLISVLDWLTDRLLDHLWPDNIQIQFGSSSQDKTDIQKEG